MTLRLGDGYRPLRDVVCDTIRDQIMNGVHTPGTRLVEDRLAAELGVSRNPVREALRVLEAEGFVEMIPRRGAVVAALSDREVEEIFEVRRALEGLAARLAARKCDARGKAAFKQVLAESRQAVRNPEPAELAALNTRFHELVVDIADNGHLRGVIVPLRGRMQWIFTRTVGARAKDSLGEHVELAEAIIAHDEDRAAELAQAHIGLAQLSYLDERKQVAATNDSFAAATARRARGRAAAPLA